MAATTGSAGTQDKAVERIEEGLASTASGNNQFRATFDAGLPSGATRAKPTANIDTSGTSGLTPDAALRKGQAGSGL
jgi:hypothetical protein